MSGLIFQRSLFIRSDASHLLFSPYQTPKSAFFKSYLHQSIPIPFGCLVVSTKTASSAIDLATPEQSNDIISLFYSYGFSEDQVKGIFNKHRRLLTADPEKTVKPKLDYLLTFGYSEPELITLISSVPQLLDISLQKQIHNMKILKQLLGSEELVKKAIARSSRLLRYNLERYIVPNVEILRMHGVPDKRIAMAMVFYPRVMTRKPDLTSSVAMELKKLGMDPSSRLFIAGFNVKAGMTQSVWDGKEALYKSLGWSNEDFLLAFTKHPFCMLYSEEKIKKMMDFYVRKLGWVPVFLSKTPVLIGLSLEERVVPRCAVLNVLASRGLLGGEMALPTLLLLTEKRFESLYVFKGVSVVRKAYEGMIEGDLTALRTWQERHRREGKYG